MEYGNSAGKFGETFLELFAVVVASWSAQSVP